MKASHLFLVFIIFKSSVAFSQDYLIKMLTTVTNMNEDMNTEYVLQIKKSGEMKIEMSSRQSTIVTAYLGENIKILRKEQGYNDLCAEGTRKDFDKSNSKNMPSMEVKDLKVEKLDGTATIVGYECKSAKITYKTTGFIPMKMENVVWYTDQFKPESNFTGTVPDGQKNAYNDAVVELGFVLKTESKGLVGVKVITETTKVKKQDFTSSEMDVDLSSCKKTLNFDDYNKQVSQREFQKQQMNDANKRAMGR